VTQQVVKLKAFDKFENTTEALAAATALVDSKLSKGASSSRCRRRRALAGRRRQSPAAAVVVPPKLADPIAHRPSWYHLCTRIPRQPTNKPHYSNPQNQTNETQKTGLKKFLKKHAEGDSLAVLDAKLGGLIKEKLGISCVAR
jgi:hypothetical protein